MSFLALKTGRRGRVAQAISDRVAVFSWENLPSSEAHPEDTRLELYGGSSSHVEKVFQTSDGLNYTVGFSCAPYPGIEGKKVCGVSFIEETQQSQNKFEVFQQVLAKVRDFINEEDPDYIHFQGTTLGLDRIYVAMANKLAPGRWQEVDNRVMVALKSNPPVGRTASTPGKWVTDKEKAEWEIYISLNDKRERSAYLHLVIESENKWSPFSLYWNPWPWEGMIRESHISGGESALDVIQGLEEYAEFALKTPEFGAGNTELYNRDFWNHAQQEVEAAFIDPEFLEWMGFSSEVDYRPSEVIPEDYYL